MDCLKGVRVLITGGAGFIGSNLARRLVREGAVVTVVDSLIPEYGGNLYNLRDIESVIRINISDVRDRYSFANLIRGQELLFNLAGQTSHLDSMEDPFTDLAINAEAQLSILEACRRHNPGVRVVFTGTRQVYGGPEYLPVDERHPLAPVDVNGINKLAGEWYHLLYHRVHGVRSCILRLTNTYGPGMRVKDARQTFLGVWIRSLLQGQDIEVWDGGQKRDFTYVDDLVELLVRAACSDAAWGSVFNVGGMDVVTLRQLAEMMVALHGSGSVRVQPFPVERKRIDIGDYYADYSKVRGALNWAPSIGLSEGLKRTIAYYADNMRHYL